MTYKISQQYARELARQVDELEAENAKLREALRDAHGLIDNDLVVPWIMAHKLDDILNEQNASLAEGWDRDAHDREKHLKGD